MYEAFWKNSDFIRANIVIADGTEVDIEQKSSYQLVQVLHIRGKTEIKIFPVPESVINSLQLAGDELRELAEANRKRIGKMLPMEEMVLKQPGIRRSHGRK